MPENRSHRRYNVDFWDILCAEIEDKDVEILDISPGGISLRAKRRLNMGASYSLMMRSKKMIMKLQGDVVWSSLTSGCKGPEGAHMSVYTAGFDFKDVSGDLKEEITRFVELHKLELQGNNDKPETVSQKKDKRLYPRVSIKPPELAVIVDHAENLLVKKLSYRGALLISKKPRKIDAVIPMIMSLAEDKMIVFKGRVASCLLIRNAIPRAYDIGIEFTELSGPDRLVLAEFIRLLDAIEKSPSL
jgi:hypothetical protein